jgi:hypothetical protein
MIFGDIFHVNIKDKRDKSPSYCVVEYAYSNLKGLKDERNWLIVHTSTS